MDYSLKQRVWASSLGHEEMSPVSEQVGTEQVCPSLEYQERSWVRAAGLDRDARGGCVHPLESWWEGARRVLSSPPGTAVRT